MAVVTEDKEQKLLTTSGELIPEKKEKSNEAVSIKVAVRARRGGSKWATLTSKRFILGYFKFMPFETKKKAVLWFEGALMAYCLVVLAVNYMAVDDANDGVIELASTNLVMATRDNETEAEVQFNKDFGTFLPVFEEYFKYFRYGCIIGLVRVVGSFWLLLSGISGASRWKLRTWIVIQVTQALVLGWVYLSGSVETENGLWITILILGMRVIVIRLIIDIIAEFKKQEEEVAAAVAAAMGALWDHDMTDKEKGLGDMEGGLMA